MSTFFNIIGALGLPIILWVILSDKELRNSNRFEIKYFYRFCYMTLAVNLYSLFWIWESNFKSTMGDSLIIGLFDSVFAFILNGGIVALGLFWLIFADASVFNSPDRIARRYKKAGYPLVFMALLIALEAIFYIYYPIGTVIILLIYYISALIIAYLYISYAWKIARTYSREMSQPMPLRMDYFVIPWIMCFVTSFISIPHLDALFSSVAALLTFLVLKKRREFTDDEHGYYKENYLPELEKYLIKKGRKLKTAILFKNNGKSNTLSDSIWDTKPDNSIVVKHSDDEYLVFIDTKNDSDVKLLISTVCALAGGDVSAYQLPRTERETLENFAVRALNRG